VRAAGTSVLLATLACSAATSAIFSSRMAFAAASDPLGSLTAVRLFSATSCRQASSRSTSVACIGQGVSQSGTPRRSPQSEFAHHMP
jgi:hypothetical protein